ncbi:MAG TPA: nucleoid-associated protein [Cyclobacteriaceae bacterium]|nr:nucleoid-associated protein [Cyclobacteriaceae bacterium]
MLITSRAQLARLSAHQVGNKTNGDDLAVSKAELEIDDDLRSRLLSYFLGSFGSEEYFQFTSTDGDFQRNPLYQLTADLFASDDQFQLRTISIAKHLYEVSVHPNIKPGDLYVARFTQVELDDQPVDVIGIFKAESQSNFLQLNKKKDGSFALDCRQGVSLDKLDKGCLIYNMDADSGYRISIVDKTSKSTEAQYWKELFLRVAPIQNHFQATKNVLDIARHFVTDQIGDEFELSKAEQVGYLKKSIDYFKSHDAFNQKEFEQEVFEDPELIKSYKKFDAGFRSQFSMDMEPIFDIAPEVVRRQARVFKSVLKLDKNFHIYIHGDRDLIERGVEKDGRKFYKIYYREEF